MIFLFQRSHKILIEISKSLDLMEKIGQNPRFKCGTGNNFLGSESDCTIEGLSTKTKFLSGR